MLFVFEGLYITIFLSGCMACIRMLYMYLFYRNGIVMLSGDSQEGKVDFRISFIRYEKKKMYLIRNEGRFFILAHFSVEECDIVHQDIPDDAVEFPLRERHYELEVVVLLSHSIVEALLKCCMK